MRYHVKNYAYVLLYRRYEDAVSSDISESQDRYRRNQYQVDYFELKAEQCCGSSEP